MALKRYILFGYYDYYPAGAHRDMITQSDEKINVNEFIKNLDVDDRRYYSTASYENYEILDTEFSILYEYRSEGRGYSIKHTGAKRLVEDENGVISWN